MQAKTSRLIRLPRVASLSLMALSIGFAIGVQAQTVTGGLHGKAPADATVTVTNPSTGYVKTVTANAQGKYSLTLLTPGSYSVSVSEDGKTLQVSTVNVVPNASAAVPNVTVNTLGTVQVTAAAINFDTVVNPIDVTTPILKSNYNAKLLHNLPVARDNIYAIALLNSSVRASSIQGSMMPQIGGASPSENRFYYNGFDTTYEVNGNGAVTVPQEAVADTQLLTGSAAISLASTTGGSMLATIKQGSNAFHAGYDFSYGFPTSHLLEPRFRDARTLDGERYSLYQSPDHHGANVTHSVWGSGPIIKDNLFFYALVQKSPTYTNTYYASGSKTINTSKSKSALLNLTWNITDNQTLDILGQKQWYPSKTVEYQLTAPYTPTSVDPDSASPSTLGGVQKFLIGNYGWHITDDLTLKLMAGYMRFSWIGTDSGSSVPWVQAYDAMTGVTTQPSGTATSDYAPTSYYYAKRGFQGSLDWWVGDHNVNFGANYYKDTYHYQPMTNPHGVWIEYLNYAPGTVFFTGAAVPPNGNIALSWYYSSGGSFFATQKSAYAYDTWHVAPDWVVTYGARYDSMENDAQDGTSYLNLHVLSPRVGFSWDVHGDSSLKIAGNFGKYTLPMPENLSYTIASAQTYTEAMYTYDSVDPETRAPVNPTMIGNNVVYNNGELPNLDALASKNLKNTYQYEYQLYAQQQLTQSWTLLAKVDAHYLKAAVDQTCDNTGVITDYVQAHGHPDYAGLVGGCIEFNPGRSIVLRDDLDADGTAQEITIPNSYLGMPKARRRFYDATLEASHAYSPAEPYYLSASYTYTRLYGNWDGYTNLSANNSPNIAPTPGQSGNYIFREFSDGTSGNLAGDVRHRILLSGYYYWRNGLHAGAVYTAHTGAPFSCLGVYPDQNSPLITYGAVTHYCGSGQLAPEGSTWRAPFYWQLDLNLGYEVHFGNGQDLRIDFTINNVTNRQRVTSRQMISNGSTFDANGQPKASEYFMSPIGLQYPRNASLFIRYQF